MLCGLETLTERLFIIGRWPDGVTWGSAFPKIPATREELQSLSSRADLAPGGRLHIGLILARVLQSEQLNVTG